MSLPDQHPTAVCTVVPGGYLLRVQGEGAAEPLVSVTCEWEVFRPDIAGHRLIEHGFMIFPEAVTPESFIGWQRLPGDGEGWSAPVDTLANISAHEAARGPMAFCAPDREAPATAAEVADMTAGDVTRHDVRAERIEQALTGIQSRTRGHWHAMRYGGQPLRPALVRMGAELVDHVAACTLEDPGLEAPRTHAVLQTAAECVLGSLALGCFPDGDWEVPFPLIDERISSDELHHEESWGPQVPTTARTWVEAFELSVASGVVRDWERVIGLLLRHDYAPAVRDGVPYSKQESVSDRADLAQMDALCGYLTPSRGHLPRDWPQVTLRMPSIDERLDAALALDAADAHAPDQRLLRVLLKDDQSAFEQALAHRLTQHRASAGADPEPAGLLPLGAIALAALAVQVHGWDLGIESGYLPASLLHAPRDARAKGPE